VLLQSVLVFVFMDRHYEFVTRRLAQATVQDISLLAGLYETYPHPNGYDAISDLARERLHRNVPVSPQRHGHHLRRPDLARADP